MSFIKRLIPNNVKLKVKYLMLDRLKIPYSRSNAPLEILDWLPKGKPITFIDIGANVGHFSQSICGEYQIKKGVLIEPIAKLIPILEKTFPDKNTFQIINAAISDSVAETDFYTNDEFDSVSSLLRINNNADELAGLKISDPATIKIQTLTLDAVTNRLGLQNIDLLKIDVQGAEHLVLRSAIETLKKTRLVYTEFSFRPLYQNSSVFIDLYNFFYQHNFILARIHPGYTSSHGELLQGDALFVNKV
ncbi:MAG: FkbM family methyltransferase [Bacteroidota bacterium]